jgi:hypothetical protein
LLLVAPKLHWAVVLAGVLLTGVTAALLALTAFSDPGYVPKQTPAQMEVQRQQMEEQGLSGTFTVCREFWVGVGGLSSFPADRQCASHAEMKLKYCLCGYGEMRGMRCRGVSLEARGRVVDRIALAKQFTCALRKIATAGLRRVRHSSAHPAPVSPG